MMSFAEILPDARLTIRGLADGLSGGVLRFCLWFSLPLSVWLMSGWVGLVLHLQAEAAYGGHRPRQTGHR